MNTPFGKILEKNIFKKVFSAVILLSSVVGAVMNSYAAVSYTHLDVYKRQKMSRLSIQIN